jgi:hypothetical protein
MTMDRVAVVAWCWFLLWTMAGTAMGALLGTPGTGAICGFLVALFAVFAWPWVMPQAINEWMNSDQDSDWSHGWPGARRHRG